MKRKMRAYSYGCIMANLPKEMSDKIRAFSALIPDEDIYGVDDIEHGREDTPHVTVKYGIHSDDHKEVEGVFFGQEEVVADLQSMSVFHNEDFVVLKMGVNSKGLRRLNRLACNELEFTDSYPTYNPHVTIAYLNHREDDEFWYKRLFCNIFKGEDFVFDELVFSDANDKDSIIKLEEMPLAKKVASKFINRVSV